MKRPIPTPAKVNWVTGVALAAELNVSKQAVNRLQKDGIISRGSNGLFDLEASKLLIAQRVRAFGKSAAAATEQIARAEKAGNGAAKAAPAASAPAAPPAPSPSLLTYQTARAEREAEEAQVAKLKRLQLERRLIDRDGTIASVFSAFRSLRDACMPVGRRVAARVITVKDPRDAQQLIDDEIRAAFATFAERTLAQLAKRLDAKPEPASGAGPETITEEAA